MRSVSAVVIIEKSTGDIIWHLDSTVVAQQHNATELPNGNILVSTRSRRLLIRRSLIMALSVMANRSSFRED